MNVHETVEHFENDLGMKVLIDWLFRDEGVEGGFPIPAAADGGKQALLYDEFGLWMLHETPTLNGQAEDAMRFFSYDTVTACTLHQGREVSDAYEDHETTFEQRSGDVLRATTLEITIAGTPFSFRGDELALMLENEDDQPVVLGDLFGIVRYCVAFGVPVELKTGVRQAAYAT